MSPQPDVGQSQAVAEASNYGSRSPQPVLEAVGLSRSFGPIGGGGLLQGEDARWRRHRGHPRPADLIDAMRVNAFNEGIKGTKIKVIDSQFGDWSRDNPLFG